MQNFRFFLNYFNSLKFLSKYILLWFKKPKTTPIKYLESKIWISFNTISEFNINTTTSYLRIEDSHTIVVLLIK